MGKRGRECTICGHREHAAIDLALARGVSQRAVAKRYRVGIDAVGRHARAHLPPQLRAQLIAGPEIEGLDLDRLRETESQSLLCHLVALRNRLFASLDTAEECGDGSMIARVASQLHHNLEITGKLLGDLGTGTTINNVLILPQYIELRMAIVRALDAFPEARIAVASALRQIEAKAAESVLQADRTLAT